MKAAAQLTICILIAWAVGWFAMQSIDDSDRDLSLPPKPIPKVVETFLLWVPISAAILVSGNAHAPSEVGLWLGLVVQWTAIGLLFFVIIRGIGRFRQRPTSETKKA
ncbi:MAG: hypothetical protein Q7S40_10470 [Opitutaceae bacterium]|nr:hypothetical protein [Opitutaceae bacterium]